MTRRLSIGDRVRCSHGYGAIEAFIPVGVGGWLVRIALDDGGVTSEVESRVEPAARARPVLSVIRGGR